MLMPPGWSIELSAASLRSTQEDAVANGEHLRAAEQPKILCCTSKIRNAVAYALHQLAPGSYDLLLNEKIIGSVVRAMANSRDAGNWYAELIEGDGNAERPVPFTKVEHAFDKLSDLLAWLGDPKVILVRQQR